MNVSTLSVIKSSKKPVAKSSSRAFAKRMKRQKFAAVFVAGVAGALVILSLSHLARGIEIVTNGPVWEGWLLAIGFDLGYTCMELAQINAATEKVSRAITRFTHPGVIATLIGSAIMNAFAFADGADGYMKFAAIIMGLSIPVLIYALTRIGAALYIDCYSKN